MKLQDKTKLRLRDLGYTLSIPLPDDYSSRQTMVEIICANGHKSIRKMDNVFQYPNCEKCRSSSTSWFDNLKSFGIKATEKTSTNSAKIIDGDRIVDMSLSQISQRWYLDPFEIYKFKAICVSRDSERSDRIRYQTVCSKGHEFEISRRSLLEGHGCRTCSLDQISEPESTIGSWVENAGFSLIRRDKSVIGKEMDIFIPDRKIGIEYCGIRWHSLESKEKTYSDEKYDRLRNEIINKHQQKMLLALSKGVHLITIFESDYIHKRQQTKDMVLDALSGVLTNTNDLRYRKLLADEKYTEPMPLYFDRKYNEVDPDDERKCYTVYDCGHLISFEKEDYE